MNIGLQIFKLNNDLIYFTISLYVWQVPSERLFSLAGATITKLRCSLDSTTADQLLFINKNMRDSPEFQAMSKGGEVMESDEYMSALSLEMYQAQQAQAQAQALGGATGEAEDFPRFFSKRAVQIPEPDDDDLFPSVSQITTRHISGQEPSLPTVPGLDSSLVKAENRAGQEWYLISTEYW